MAERSLWQRGHTDACAFAGCPCYIEGKTAGTIDRAAELVRLGAALGDIRTLLQHTSVERDVLRIVDTALGGGD